MTGITGWNAFSSHCPKDGNIVVLFASHAGINEKGEIGTVLRRGHKEPSMACSALQKAYLSVKQNPANGDFLQGYMDHQMDTIKHLLVPHIASISNSKNEQAALVHKMYALQEQFLEEIINKTWMTEKSQLALIGGIMINFDDASLDKFLPMKFEIRKKNHSEDIFDQTFETASTQGYSI